LDKTQQRKVVGKKEGDPFQAEREKDLNKKDLFHGGGELGEGLARLKKTAKEQKSLWLRSTGGF